MSLQSENKVHAEKIHHYWGMMQALQRINCPVVPTCTLAVSIYRVPCIGGICWMVHKVKPIPWKNFETARLLLLLLLLLWSLFSLDQSFHVILIKDFMLVMHCLRISELHIPVNNIGTTYWLHERKSKMQYTHYASN